MQKHEMISLREAIFSTTAEKCHLSRLETITLKQMPARPNVTAKKEKITQTIHK